MAKFKNQGTARFRGNLSQMDSAKRPFKEQMAYHGISMAAPVMATIPAVVFFLALQRYFVQGIALSGLKS
jgi:ABC-type glycerol-3-phosphate transport system permease component